MNKQYTQKQIVESIDFWSNYMLENGMATQQELNQILGEGWLRRAKGAVKRGLKKVKQVAHDINWYPQKVIDKVFKPNDGVQKMLKAMNDVMKQNKGVDYDAIRIWISIAGKVSPVIGFAFAKRKTTLILLVDKDNQKAKPKTLADLRKFFGEAKVNVKDAVDSIVCAGIPKSQLFESILLEYKPGDGTKFSKYIEDNKLTKKKALMPDAVNALKRIIKQSAETTKEKIDKYFSNAAASKSKAKKDTKNGKNAKEKLDHSSADASIVSKPSNSKQPTFSDDATAGAQQSVSKDSIVVFDNKLLDVRIDKKNIGFIFSKSKEELALDKKFADMLAV